MPFSSSLGLSPARFIVVPPGSLGSLLACPLGSHWPSSCLDSCSLDFATRFLGFLPPLVLRRALPLLPEPLLGIVSKLTCMSDSDRLWTLEFALRDLGRTVDNLSTRLSNLERRLHAPVGWWEVALEESPFGIRHNIPASRFLQVEDGPPQVPASFLDFAKDKLPESPGYRHRVVRAFEAGFWANVSAVCHVSYSPAGEIPLEETQWVIYRAAGLSRPCRVLDRLELDRLLTLPGPPVNPIVQGFHSDLEVKIFCAGGGRVVPALLQWRSPQ